MEAVSVGHRDSRPSPAQAASMRKTSAGRSSWLQGHGVRFRTDLGCSLCCSFLGVANSLI